MNNVEKAREFWAMWNCEALQTLLVRYDEFFTEDLEWRSPVAEMEGRSVVGRAEFKAHIANLLETFDEIEAKLLEAEEVAPDVVRCVVQMHGRGSQSGAVTDAPLIALARFRDGRMAWAWGSFVHDEADRMTVRVANETTAEAGR